MIAEVLLLAVSVSGGSVLVVLSAADDGWLTVDSFLDCSLTVLFYDHKWVRSIIMRGCGLLLLYCMPSIQLVLPDNAKYQTPLMPRSPLCEKENIILQLTICTTFVCLCVCDSVSPSLITEYKI